MNTPLPTASPRPARAAALTAALCLLLAGCSGSDGDDGDDGDAAGRAGTGRMRVALVTHGGAGDAFWDLVKKGAEAAAAKDGVDLVHANDSDTAGQAELVRDAVRDKVDGIAVTLAKPQAMKGPVAAAAAAGSGAEVATFDLNEDLVRAVQAGNVQFAVDQQPYLQGYLAVDALWLYRTNGNVSGGGVSPVLTGPAFVTEANVDAVARFAADGTR
ncbi:substrate-binding domain-containing protein [Streptomyces glaucus]|uniref:Periplasmic binding protein domain-containing protein n=1 Tax=Streptomyces glaucus TaxID=284029 RepID=A0ABN3JB84_9ACTN